MEFKLLRFNPFRFSRQAPAAEVECFDDGGSEILWMSKKEIRLNIQEFGPHPELTKALEHYRTTREFPPRVGQ
jgi:hypothetical protein